MASETDTQDLPESTDQLKRALWDGECFMWEYYDRRLYFDCIEGYGTVVTETDGHGRDPCTLGNPSHDQLKTALRWGHLERIDSDDIPYTDKD